MQHEPAPVVQATRPAPLRAEGAHVARTAAATAERPTTFAAITTNLAGWFAGTRASLADDFVLA